MKKLLQFLIQKLSLFLSETRTSGAAENRIKLAANIGSTPDSMATLTVSVKTPDMIKPEQTAQLKSQAKLPSILRTST